MLVFICHHHGAGVFESDTELGMEEVYVWMVRTSYEYTVVRICTSSLSLCSALCRMQCHPAPDRHHVLHDMVVHPLRRRLLLAHLRPSRDTSLR